MYILKLCKATESSKSNALQLYWLASTRLQDGGDSSSFGDILNAGEISVRAALSRVLGSLPMANSQKKTQTVAANSRSPAPHSLLELSSEQRQQFLQTLDARLQGKTMAWSTQLADQTEAEGYLPTKESEFMVTVVQKLFEPCNGAARSMQSPMRIFFANGDGVLHTSLLDESDYPALASSSRQPFFAPTPEFSCLLL